MDEKEKQKFLEMKVKNRNWVGNIEDHTYDSSTSIGSISEDSMDSVCSSTSSEMADEASSSSSTNYLSTSSSSSLSNGPLFELSQLMTHLPIKRGLSMFYEGKAQSFSCLGRVRSLEDVPKKELSERSKATENMKDAGKSLKSNGKSSSEIRRDRKSATGMNGSPKKGGHGGKFTWIGHGYSKVEIGREHEALDAKDPNFEDQEEVNAV